MSEQVKEIATIIAGYIGAGAVGSLLTILITHRLTIDRERMLRREDGIAKDKKQFIFAIDELIETTRNCGVPDLIRARFHRLYTPYLMFKPHLKGKRLRAYEEAWKRLQGTTEREASGNSPTGSYDMDSAELHKIQRLLISRLEAVREIVHDT